MASEEGIVTRVARETAWVRTTPGRACEGCPAKGSCSERGPEREVEVLNPAGARVGDRVVVQIDTGPLLRATFLVYLFPILCLAAGAAAGHVGGPALGLDPSAAAALGGFSCLAAALIVVRIRANRMACQTAYRPRIVRIFSTRSSTR